MWCLICWYLWPFVDSPYPPEGLEFLTLWCRWVNVSLSSWMVTMRDYPQPWLEVKDMHLWGRLIGAEQEGLKRGLFTVFLFRVSEMCGLQKGFSWKQKFVTNFPCLQNVSMNADILAIFISLLFCFLYIAKRSCKVSVGGPWGEMSVERNLPALKFYHDFSCGKYQYLYIFI